MKLPPNRRSGRAGFTLIEVLLVLAIIVILGSLVGFAFTRMQKRGFEGVARTQINAFKTPLRTFKLDLGIYPSTLEELTSAPSGSGDQSRWDGPYLDEAVPLDPWGRPYQYKQLEGGEDYEVWSEGPNPGDASDNISNKTQK